MDTSVYHSFAERDARHWFRVGRRAIVRARLELCNFGSPGRVLEIGCGSAGNSDFLGAYGDYVGLEPSEIAINLIPTDKKLAVDIRRGSWPEDADALAGERFAVVALLDVLEHMQDDESAVAKLPDVLSPGGTAVVTVPAYQWLWSQHDELMHHKRRYRASEVRSLLERNGFSVSYIGFFNSILFPLAVVVRLLGERFGSKRSVGYGVPPAALNSVLRFVLRIEEALVRFVRLPFGLSILVVAQLPE